MRVCACECVSPIGCFNSSTNGDVESEKRKSLMKVLPIRRPPITSPPSASTRVFSSSSEALCDVCVCVCVCVRERGGFVIMRVGKEGDHLLGRGSPF